MRTVEAARNVLRKVEQQPAHPLTKLALRFLSLTAVRSGVLRMRGLMARPRRRGLPTDHGERSVIAYNVLDRQFSGDAPNRKGGAATDIWTAEAWLYVAAVIELFSRRVVG